MHVFQFSLPLNPFSETIHMPSRGARLLYQGLASLVKPTKTEIKSHAQVLADQMGVSLDQARPTLVVRTLEEQGRAADALEASIYPGLLGLDCEFVGANKRTYRKDQLEAKLQRIWDQPPQVQEAMIQQGSWPKLRNPNWPTAIPMFRDSLLFRDKKGQPRFGPVIRSIQLASIEGFTVVFDLINSQARYELHERIASLLLNPAVIKAVYSPAQDRTALGLSFSNVQSLDLYHSPTFDPDQKWSHREYAQIGWLDVQPDVSPRPKLTSTLQAYGADEAVLRSLQTMKQQMGMVFKRPFATVRPLEWFDYIGIGEQVHHDLSLDLKFVAYGAADANAALYLGLMQFLLASEAIRAGPNIKDQLARVHEFANEHVRVQRYDAKRLYDPSSTPQQMTIEARRSIVRAMGPYWPGERLACRYSRQMLHWDWPFMEYPTSQNASGLLGQVDWRL